MAGWMRMSVSDWKNENEMNGEPSLKPEYPSRRYNRLREIWMMEEIGCKTRVKLRRRKSKARQDRSKHSVRASLVDEEVWRISTRRLFHKIGAWWKKDMLVIFRRDVTVGRRKVTTEEERVLLLVWTEKKRTEVSRLVRLQCFVGKR